MRMFRVGLLRVARSRQLLLLCVVMFGYEMVSQTLGALLPLLLKQCASLPHAAAHSLQLQLRPRGAPS